MKDFLGLLLVAAAIAFLAFMAGAAAIVFRVPATEPLYTALDNARKLTSDNSVASVGDLHQLYPARYAGSGVTVNATESTQAGVTLITGYWWEENRWQPAIRLIDMQGDTLHEWIVRPNEIWPESPFTDHVAGQMNNPNNYVHGARLLPGGDVIFNVEYAGMVRMNACAEVIWTLPYRTHHSVFQDENGNFWAAGLNWRYEKNPAYVHPKPNFVDETVLQVSPDGEILREIFVLKSIYDSGYGGIFADTQKKLDITHLNDVEVLSTAMAAQFPDFNAGDIIVSLRNISTVLVIDGVTERVKWRLQYPLVRQHDPDFEPDGSIVIFDNRDDTTQEGSKLGPSRLLKIDPATGAQNTVYPLSADQAFYTQTGGKHQLLANGNRLITEAHAGRVFEVNADGNVVWNWLADNRDGLVPEVLEGSRYPAALAEFDRSACSAE